MTKTIPAKSVQVNVDLEKVKPTPNDYEWTDYVLSQLKDNEKIDGNPTTDGLRRIFETVMDCEVISSISNVLQVPEPNNDRRCTVVHTITFMPNTKSPDEYASTKVFTGASDSYWGNTDSVFRAHPVAVAETKAEGRALRRAMKLTKVITADEKASESENFDGDSVDKITVDQLSFINNLASRLDINVRALLDSMSIDHSNIRQILHKDGVSVIQKLNSYQRDKTSIPSELIGYNTEWRNEI